MAKRKRPDILERWIRLGVRTCIAMRKQGVEMHISVTFLPPLKKAKYSRLTQEGGGK